MAKILKKKFFEVEIPLIEDKFEAYANSIEELQNKIVKLDITRQLKGKSVDLVLKVVLKEGKLSTFPKKLTLLPSFIQHMMHAGVSYIEDSFITETQDYHVTIKPFLITRKKVSRSVRRTLRNSAKNWLIDYLKTKTADEIFQEVLSNQLQKPLSIKLKKIYPLAVCEIRILEITKPIAGKPELKSIGEIEIKKQVSDEGKQISEEISENVDIEPEESKAKPKAKKSSKKAETEIKEEN